MEQVRSNFQQRGQRLSRSLGVLIALYLLLGILTIMGMIAMLVFVNSLLTPAELASSGLSLGLLSAIVGVTVLITAVFYVLMLLALRTAQQAIVGVQRFVISGEADQVDLLAGRLNSWLSAGQWYMLISGVLGVVLTPLLLLISDRVAPTQDTSLTGFSAAFVFVGTLIQMLPIVILTWLILAAIKRFFSAVRARARGEQVRITPSASTAGSWLIFTIVVIAIGLFFAALSVVMVSLFAFIPDMAGSLENDPTQPFSAAVFRGLMIGSAVLLLLSAGLYGLLIAMMAWSRGFALDTARLLDDSLSALSTPPNSRLDLWKSPSLPPSQHLP